MSKKLKALKKGDLKWVSGGDAMPMPPLLTPPSQGTSSAATAAPVQQSTPTRQHASGTSTGTPDQPTKAVKATITTKKA